MDLEWYLLVVARAAGMLAEFGTERDGKSREKQKPGGKGKGMFCFPFPIFPFP